MDKTKLWLYQIAAAFIGGGASAVTAGLSAIGIDPQTFNLSTGLGKTFMLIGVVFLVSGTVSVMLYLKQHPLPDWDGNERRNGD